MSLFTATAGAEILICITSGLVSLRVAYIAKKEVHKKNEGTFSVVVVGEKDIRVDISRPTKSDEKLNLTDPQKTSSHSLSTVLAPTASAMTFSEEQSQSGNPLMEPILV